MIGSSRRLPPAQRRNGAGWVSGEVESAFTNNVSSRWVTRSQRIYRDVLSRTVS